MKSIFVMLFFIFSSVSTYAGIKQFSCDHGGAGNDNISGTIHTGQSVEVQSLIYSSGSGLKPLDTKIFTDYLFISNNKIKLTGFFLDDGKRVSVGLDLTGLFKEEQVNGEMIIGWRNPSVHTGNCTFSGWE